MPRPDDQLELLAGQRADIMLLQDVGPSAVRARGRQSPLVQPRRLVVRLAL